MGVVEYELGRVRPEWHGRGGEEDGEIGRRAMQMVMAKDKSQIDVPRAESRLRWASPCLPGYYINRNKEVLRSS